MVVVHGLAGSQQTVQSYALTAAAAGFVTVTLDLPGHGADLRPLPSVDAGPARDRAVLAAVSTAVGYARTLGDGRVGLIGHSMGADAVIRYAAGHPEVGAVIALAPGTDLPPDGAGARDLLVLTGALDVATRPVALRIAAQADGGRGRTGRTYGDPGTGTARRVVLVPGVEHLGILFSDTAQDQARTWLLAALPGTTTGAPVDPGRDGGPTGRLLPGLAATYLGAAVLLASLVRWLPTATGPAGAALPGRRPQGTWRWWLAAAPPAVLGALAAAALPVERVLPIAVAGRVAVLMAIQGAGTLLALRVGRSRGAAPARRPVTGPWARPAGTVLWLAVVLGAVALVVGYPTQEFVMSVLPSGRRWGYALACSIAVLPWAAADSTLRRDAGAPRAAAVITTGGLFAAWLVAIELNPQRLGFLTVVGPLLAGFLIAFAGLGALVRRRTGQPALEIGLRAVTFGWILATVLPVVT